METTLHTLYIKICSPGDKDEESRAVTLKTLEFLKVHKNEIKKMNVSIKVTRITSEQLRDKRVLDLLKKNKITSLPALITPNNIYIGFGQISTTYKANIKELEALERRGEIQVSGYDEDDNDPIARMQRKEMSWDRLDDDQEEDMSNSEGLMESFRQAVEYRQRMAERRKPVTFTKRAANNPPSRDPPARGPPARGPPARGPPARGSPARPRPDNIGEQDDIDASIARLARELDDTVISAAFTSPDTDSADDGQPDPKDDLMVGAYWSRNEASDM